MRLGYLLQHLKTLYKDFYTTIGSAVLNRKVVKLSPVLEKIIHLVDATKCTQFLYFTIPFILCIIFNDKNLIRILIDFLKHDFQ